MGTLESGRCFVTEVDWERLRRCVSLESEEKGKQIEMMTDKQMDRISTYRLSTPVRGQVKKLYKRSNNCFDLSHL